MLARRRLKAGFREKRQRVLLRRCLREHRRREARCRDKHCQNDGAVQCEHDPVSQ
jgi:hypothetical protein